MDSSPDERGTETLFNARFRGHLMKKRLIVLDVNEETYELILDGYSPFSTEVASAGLTIVDKIGEPSNDRMS